MSTSFRFVCKVGFAFLTMSSQITSQGARSISSSRSALIPRDVGISLPFTPASNKPSVLERKRTLPILPIPPTQSSNASTSTLTWIRYSSHVLYHVWSLSHEHVNTLLAYIFGGDSVLTYMLSNKHKFRSEKSRWPQKG